MKISQKQTKSYPILDQFVEPYEDMLIVDKLGSVFRILTKQPYPTDGDKRTWLPSECWTIIEIDWRGNIEDSSMWLDPIDPTKPRYRYHYVPEDRIHEIQKPK